MRVSVHEAKTQLSKLLNLVEEGEEVVILRHNRPVGRIVPAHAAAKPRLGAMRAELSWQEGWERPLSPEEAETFWEGRWQTAPIWPTPAL